MKCNTFDCTEQTENHYFHICSPQWQQTTLILAFHKYFRATRKTKQMFSLQFKDIVFYQRSAEWRRLLFFSPPISPSGPRSTNPNWTSPHSWPIHSTQLTTHFYSALHSDSHLLCDKDAKLFWKVKTEWFLPSLCLHIYFAVLFKSLSDKH